jgi:hypothetical protein
MEGRGRAGQAWQGRSSADRAGMRHRTRRLDLVRVNSAVAGLVVVSCPGRCLTLQSHQMAYGCAVSRLRCRMSFAGVMWLEAGIGTGRVVGGRAAVPGCAGGGGGGSGDGGR